MFVTSSPKTGFIARRLCALVTVLTISFNNNYAQGLSIQNGARVVASGKPQIVIQDGLFSNSGQFVAGESTVRLTGNTVTPATIGGTATTTFYNLELNRPNAGTLLLRSMNVDGELRMNGGLLELNMNAVDLGFTGLLLNETETNRITGVNGGSIKSQALLNGPVLANPGNLGFSVSSTANLGLTTIIRKHTPQTNLSGAGSSINRSYEIVTQNNNALNATMRLQYFDAELNSLPENDLVEWGSNDQTNWQNNNRDSLCQINKWVEKRNLTSFQNFYTLSTRPSFALPLQLISFTAQNQQEKVVLDWEAYNNDLLAGSAEIERSATAANGTFQKLGTVAQPASVQAKFQFLDEKPLPGASFYRLKMINADGTVLYSQTRRVVTTVQQKVQVYPMPVSDRLNINLPAAAAATVVASIWNTNGQQVISQPFELQAGINTFALNMAQLPQGVYILKFSQPEYQDVKIIKQ